MTERRTSPLAIWLIVTALLLVAYPLSVGPAMWLTQKGYLPHGVYQTTYWPMVMLCIRCRPLRGPIDWYVKVWEPADEPTRLQAQ